MGQLAGVRFPFLVNVLNRVPKQRQGEARELLTTIPYQASER